MSAPEYSPVDDHLLLLSANLLPAEVVQGRQVKRIRMVAIATLTVAALLAAAVYGLAWARTARAEADLATVSERADHLRAQQGQYSELIQAQTSAQQIKQQLAILMANDVTWTAFLRSIRTATPSGVELTGVVASITDPAERAGGEQNTASGLPSTTGSPIGTLTITGVGSTNVAIAAFADALAKVSGVGSALLGGATDQDIGIGFTIKADLSPSLLSQLYAVKTD